MCRQSVRFVQIWLHLFASSTLFFLVLNPDNSQHIFWFGYIYSLSGCPIVQINQVVEMGFLSGAHTHARKDTFFCAGIWLPFLLSASNSSWTPILHGTHLAKRAHFSTLETVSGWICLFIPSLVKHRLGIVCRWRKCCEICFIQFISFYPMFW